MKRLAVITLLFGALVGLIGCSNRAVAPVASGTPATGAVAATGGLAFTLKWPARSSRMPTGTRSVKIDINVLSTGEAVTGSPKIVNAPVEGPDLTTTTVKFGNLPAKALVVKVQAFASSDADGDVLGVGGQVVSIQPGKFATATINLNGTIVSASIPSVPAFLNGTSVMMVEARDKYGELVPVPTPVTWISTDPTTIAVSTNSDGTANMTGKKIGTAIIRAILPSGITADASIPVWYQTFEFTHGTLLTLHVGAAQPVALKATDGTGTAITINPTDVVWTDSDPFGESETTYHPPRGRTLFSGNGTYRFAADYTVTALARGAEGLFAYIPATRQIAVSGVHVVGFQAVAGGDGFSVALDDLGQVWSWGKNTEGQLGHGNTLGSNRPVPVPNLANVRAIAAGTGHILALQTNGDVWAWGNNTHLQTGQAGGAVLVPTRVMGLANVHYIAAGANHSLASSSTGAYAWGSNSAFELGTYNPNDTATPQMLVGLYSIGGLAAGNGVSYAISHMPTTGTPWCWGTNTFGQLGTNVSNLTHYSNYPMSFAQEGAFDDITQIAAHKHLAAAMDSAGVVAVWGENPITHSAMIQPFGLDMPQALDIAVGDHHLLTRTGSSIWVWGDNAHGQLGTGDTTARTLPAAITLPVSITAVAAGGTHSLAIDVNGGVWAWGDGALGQIGHGEQADVLAPKQLTFSTSTTVQGKGRTR
jgi:alpha-tubulin suppressor-like RCC1 family protein